MKNIYYILSIVSISLILACSNTTKSQETPETVKNNTVAEKETTKGWIQLFNGKNLEGWEVKINGFDSGENAFNTFRAKNNSLVVSYENYDHFKDYYGHIFYKNSYSNYKLRLDYRFVGEQCKGGEGWATKNSGVMIHSQSPKSMEKDQEFPVSIEVQLLGGIQKPWKRPTANLCTPGTHVNINNKLVTTHCISSSSETYYGEEWVNLEIEVHNDSIIKHYINNKEVFSYTNPVIGGQYNTLKNKKGEKLKEGYISLQSESHPIEFRNIELLILQ